MSNENVRILLFHRVCYSGEFPGPFITPGQFRKILNYLSYNYTVISLEDYFFKERNKFIKSPVILTFDNNYRDFMEYSLPLLLEYKMPSTLFIGVEYIDHKMMDWPHLVDSLFSDSGILSIAPLPFEVGFNVISSWASVFERKKYSIKLKKFLVTLPVDQRQAIIRFYLEQFNDVNINKGQVMSWADILYIKKKGIEIGTHIDLDVPIVSAKNEKQLSHDLQHSALRIREEMGNTPASVSFSSDRNNSKLKNMIHHSGYKLGLSVGQKIYSYGKYGRYSIPRIELYNENIFFSRLRIYGAISRIKAFLGH